jgi:rare lipoprotein A
MMKKLALTLATTAFALSGMPADAQTATYYSGGFHGKKTASGARFNNGAPVAAHPSLPFGTRVKVTNRNNGRSVIVQVVDRCRCSIDLSQAAFRAIGSLGAGSLPVRLQVLN